MTQDRLPRSHPLAHLRLSSLNYEEGIATFVGVDGHVESHALDFQRNGGSLVTRSTFFPHESRVEIVAAGRSLTLVLGTSEERLPGPVVYLDQRDWIDFARWEKDAAGVSPDKKMFFEVLAQASADQRVVLPISGAHLVETAKRGGPSRIELASTMLRHSRGWQMRSVAALRRAELRALFGGGALTKPDVVTLAPQAALDMRRGAPPAPDLGPEISGLLERQVWATVLTDLLLDTNPTPDEGKEACEQWAQSFVPLATAIPGNAKAKARLRDLTRVRFISDLGDELPAAANERGVTADDFGSWLATGAERDIAHTPGLGRMREVLHLRLSNANETWEGNDLNDWLHLSYAAGYLDLVLGERKTVNYLRRAAPRVPAGAALHFRAEEALGDLQQLLA